MQIYGLSMYFLCVWEQIKHYWMMCLAFIPNLLTFTFYELILISYERKWTLKKNLLLPNISTKVISKVLIDYWDLTTIANSNVCLMLPNISSLVISKNYFRFFCAHVYGEYCFLFNIMVFVNKLFAERKVFVCLGNVLAATPCQLFSEFFACRVQQNYLKYDTIFLESRK